MLSLIDHSEAMPLKGGQKVLALTFMHGSRRRLEERLGQLQALKGRTECSTIDSFAWHLVRRWLSLAAALGFADIKPDQYERVCDAAGALLRIKEVCGWVAATFPVLLVDEAQDMTENRLRLVQGLANRLEVFAAADEFQCLTEDLRPNPACAWLAQVCPVEELIQPRRTNIAELLDAAAAIRKGQPPPPIGKGIHGRIDFDTAARGRVAQRQSALVWQRQERRRDHTYAGRICAGDGDMDRSEQNKKGIRSVFNTVGGIGGKGCHWFPWQNRP